ncbi:hypothetical protein D9758_011611 [Tetrapyrgos nigripes]|uniref:Uncharacterized protein n=1 Tax=Tetrapyrgos nigripes TaxID=182062 RepID=A0A8H5CS95_9AGAR|nr:hypothetical protein D9758_011611 [Tetrapyrgos nigripes]
MTDPDKVNYGLLLSNLKTLVRISLLISNGIALISLRLTSTRHSFRSAILPGHGAIISPKFFRYLDTLSELAICVPLTQITIPPAVYEEKQHEAKIAIPNIHSSPSCLLHSASHLRTSWALKAKKVPSPVSSETVSNTSVNLVSTTKASSFVHNSYPQLKKLTSQVVSLEIRELEEDLI